MLIQQRYEMERLRGTLPVATNELKGMIMIADISGFTDFVRTVDPVQGVQVIRHLLEAVIADNTLGLAVSEIEGDAVLFYKTGKPAPYDEVIRQFERMSAGFKKRWKYYCEKLNAQCKMELKVIVHYGEFIPYQLHGFTKLYGYSMIQVHRLLKNSVMINRYLLLTEDYLSAVGYSDEYAEQEVWQCELYGDIGEICYNYLPPTNELLLNQ